MNPKELGELLGNLSVAHKRDHPHTYEAMRQAADLLAKARVEWRYRHKNGGMSRVFWEKPSEAHQAIMRSRSYILGTYCAIETPWVAEEGAP